jgi:hypothetical protein
MDANTYFLNQYLDDDPSEEDRDAEVYYAELEWKYQQEKQMIEDQKND